MSDDQRERSEIELAVNRFFAQDPHSRRAFLRRAGRGTVYFAGALSLPAILAACAPGPGASAAAKLAWLNWPAYIDIDEESPADPTQYPSINAFIRQYGINVEYSEGLLANADFLATVSPDLRAGNPTGWDVMTPGGWVVERMARNGWLEELDHSKLPNWTTNCADYAKGLRFDPDNKHSLWWQGGTTGIAYDPNLTGREITSFDDLLDPAFAGSVGGFKDMRDMFGLTLLSLGVHPEDATIDDVTRAQQTLLSVPRGHFRGWYDNSYYDALAAGDLAISVAWSGDITQMNLYDNDKVKFVLPDSGGMRWNDNLVIPKGTPNVDNAHKLLNYWYDPVAATTLSEYIGYFTPVKGVKERILADAQTARDAGDTENAGYLEGTAPAVVPDPAQIANTFTDKQMTEEENTQWEALFEVVLGG